MGGYESTREQLAAAIGERDPNDVLVTGSVSSDWLLELSFRIDALEQRISDVNDAALYDFAQLEERIDALERRIEVLERKLNHKSIKIADESLKNGGTE